MRTLICLLALMAVMILPQAVTAQDQPVQGGVSEADQAFMVKAAQGGVFEVQMGQVAFQKAINPQVKEFAQRMVNDHSEANNQLKAIAEMKGVKLPQEMDETHKQEYDRLSKIAEDEFDHAYMETMVRDHQKDVSEFQKAQNDVIDPDLKAWVTKTLPTLNDHLVVAQQVQQQIKGGQTK